MSENGVLPRIGSKSCGSSEIDRKEISSGDSSTQMIVTDNLEDQINADFRELVIRGLRKIPRKAIFEKQTAWKMIGNESYKISVFYIAGIPIFTNRVTRL